MKKWFLLGAAVILVLPFALGLRIDFKVLGEKLQNKSDTNAESLRKMGIDPSKIDFKAKSWWTFRSEDNLIRRALGWNPVKELNEKTWESSRKMKNELIKKQYGIDMEESLKEQARDAAAKAAFYKQMTGPGPEEDQ